MFWRRAHRRAIALAAFAAAVVLVVLLSTLGMFRHSAGVARNDFHFLRERNRPEDFPEVEVHQSNQDSLSSSSRPSPFSAVIVGAGAAGLSAAYTLRQLGVDDVVILEASTALGGRVRKDETFTDYPLDLGASFVYPPKRYRKLPGTGGIRVGVLPGVGPLLMNRTWNDFLADHLAPKVPGGIVYGCQVDRVDYRSSGGVEVSCRNGKSRTYVADYAVVTVPLSVLKGGDIAFNPPLPSAIAEHHPRDMWEGFKIFIEFSSKFYPESFCFKDEEGKCEGKKGEIYFWDSSAVHKESTKNVVAGYIVGEPARSYVKKDDSKIAAKVLKLLDTRFGGKAKKNYVKHFVMNWSKEPFIRGAYSNEVEGVESNGAQNVRDRVFVAGEAFPISGDEQGWVHTAMNSGDDAAKKILLSRNRASRKADATMNL